MSDLKIQIFHMIDEAIHVDSIGQTDKAYLKYTESVLTISRYIMDQYQKIGFPYEFNYNQDIQKVLALGKECWERLNKLISELGKKELINKKQSTIQERKESVSVNSKIPEKTIDSMHETQKLFNKESNSCKILISPFDQLPLPNTPLPKSQLTPLEKCRKFNIQLRQKYQQRMMQIENPIAKANLQLELQRKIAENIEIAKSKEAQYLEEQQRKQKETFKKAERILSQNGEIGKEKCQLYANILQYEEQPWMKHFQQKLEVVPINKDCIEDIILKTLKSYHPLTKWLNFKQNLFHEKCNNLLTSNKKFQENLCADIIHELNQDKETDQKLFMQSNGDDSCIINESEINLLKNEIGEFVIDICNCIDTCVLMLGLIYNKLQSEINQDICFRIVENVILTPLWKYLILLFRYSNFEIEMKIARTMIKCFKYTPVGFGFKKVLNEKSLSSYNDCITELKLSSSVTSPISKLNLFVKTVQKICENHRTDDSGCPLTPILLGADDLIPILSYVLVQTGMPCLLSECEALEHLLDQRLLLGEEGYCLTSFQMAFKYLEAQSNK